MQLPYTIVAFSHLRWNFVYQRPQHLLSRLAAMHPVVFVEEPEFEEGPPHWDRSTPQPNVTVYRPRTPIRSPGFDGEQQAALEPLIAELSADLGNATLVAWLYTPMALPLALSLDPQAAVYDCMDELSLFLGAPPQLLTLESQLLEYADVMFTGGPSLFRAKQSRHPNVHCFPSSVDAEHFRLKDRQGKQVAESEEQSDIPHPRLGFYGVIDERLDLEIVERLSEAHPEWHIVLVGPVVKIDPDRLPDAVVCYMDNTVALPLLTAYAHARHRKRPLKRLYDKRAKMMKALRDEFERARGPADAAETDSILPMHR